MVAFVILLVCLLAAFFSGVWIGRERAARGAGAAPAAPRRRGAERRLEELAFSRGRAERPSVRPPPRPPGAEPTPPPSRADRRRERPAATRPELARRERRDRQTCGADRTRRRGRGRRRRRTRRAGTRSAGAEAARRRRPTPAPPAAPRERRRRGATRREPRDGAGQMVDPGLLLAPRATGGTILDRLRAAGYKAFLRRSRWAAAPCTACASAPSPIAPRRRRSPTQVAQAAPTSNLDTLGDRNRAALAESKRLARRWRGRRRSGGSPCGGEPRPLRRRGSALVAAAPLLLLGAAARRPLLGFAARRRRLAGRRSPGSPRRSTPTAAAAPLAWLLLALLAAYLGALPRRVRLARRRLWRRGGARRSSRCRRSGWRSRWLRGLAALRLPLEPRRLRLGRRARRAAALRLDRRLGHLVPAGAGQRRRSRTRSRAGAGSRLAAASALLLLLLAVAAAGRARAAASPRRPASRRCA